MKKLLAASALVVAMLSSTGPALALGFHEIYILQSQLANHGFDAGRPDGRLGPATRRAVAAFAEQHGIASDPESVLAFMFQRSRDTRIEITDQDTLQIIEAEVAQNLRDPSSVMIRNVFRVTDGTGQWVCGEVNGRNAYGGYAGFTGFTGMMVLAGGFVLIGIAEQDNPFITLRCATSFPKQE